MKNYCLRGVTCVPVSVLGLGLAVELHVWLVDDMEVDSEGLTLADGLSRPLKSVNTWSLVATSADSVPRKRSGLTRGLPIAPIVTTRPFSLPCKKKKKTQSVMDNLHILCLFTFHCASWPIIYNFIRQQKWHCFRFEIK